MRTSHPRSFRPAGGVLLSALLVASCSTSRPPSELHARVNEVTASPAEVRIRIRSLAPPFAGVVEDAADRMGALSATPEERLSAVRFKVETVPALFAALFRPDPIEALADAWVLTVQLRAFFETGRGRLFSPEARAIALEACDRLYADLLAQTREIAPGADTARFETQVKEWAAAHPIESLAARPSTASFFARLVAEPSLGVAQTTGKIAEDLADMGLRMDFMTATLPKQARWQAEWLLFEAATAPDGRGLLEAARNAGTDATRAVVLLDRAIRLLETLPGSVDAQRKAVLADLRGERETILASARAEREALQAFASEERKGVFAAIRGGAGGAPRRRRAAARSRRSPRRAGSWTGPTDRLTLRLGAAACCSAGPSPPRSGSRSGAGAAGPEPGRPRPAARGAARGRRPRRRDGDLGLDLRRQPPRPRREAPPLLFVFCASASRPRSCSRSRRAGPGRRASSATARRSGPSSRSASAASSWAR